MTFATRQGEEVQALLVDRLDELRPYEREWDRLAVACGKPTSRPVWLLAWWNRSAPEGQDPRALRVVVVTEGERLVGLFPGYLVDRSSPLPDLRLIGSGPFWSVEPLVGRDAPRETWGLFARVLRDSSPSPSRVELPVTPTRAEWPGELRRSWPGRGARLRRGRRGRVQVIEGPMSSEAWRAGLTQRLRADLRRRDRRRAEARFAVKRTESADMVENDLHALAELHQARWKGRSQWLVDGVEETIAEAGRKLIAGGDWRLWKVVRGGDLVGATLFARAGDTSEVLLTAFDPEWSKFAPGLAAMVAGIASELDAGARLIDFGHGGFEYVQRLSNAEHPVVNLELFPANARMPMARARWLPPHGRERTEIWRKQLRLRHRLRALRGRING